MHNKKLGAGGIGAGGTGHRQHAALMAQVILDTIEEKLTLDAVAGATHTGTIRAAALNHETRDDTVENQTIIVVMIGQINKVVNALGCGFGVQFALDYTAVFHGNLKSRICHC